MAVELTRAAIDLGIVVADEEAMLRFYRDTLGLEYLNRQTTGPGGYMHRLACGESVIKLVVPPETPASRTPRGPRTQTGLRYFTILVSNLEEVLARCEEAGLEFHVPLKAATHGGMYAQVYDPDGNVVAFVHEDEDRERGSWQA